MNFAYLFAWLQDKLPPNSLKYSDNNFFTCLLDAAIVLSVLLLLYIPLRILRIGAYIMCPEPPRRKWLRFYCALGTIFCWTVCEIFLAVLVSLFVGLFVLIAVIYGKLSLYLGIAVLALWFSLSIFHACRAREDNRKKMYTEIVDNNGEGEEDYDTQHERYYTHKKVYEDNGQVMLKLENFSYRIRLHLLMVKERVKSYPSRLLEGLKSRWHLFAVAVLAALILSALISLLTCNLCITSMPTELSTSFTRMITRQEFCKWGAICFLYATVPQDMSSSLIINFHLFSYAPFTPVVYVSQQPFEPWNATVNPMVTIFKARCVRMHRNLDEERYQCTGDLINLEPNSTYYVAAAAGLKYNNFAVSNKLYKFRTAPSTSYTGPIRFINGGDFQWSKSGIALSQYAALQEPLFALIGGDVVYDNGNPFCFMRYDFWMTNWETRMITPENYSIPLLTVVGNHESGGFVRPRTDDEFYLLFFPHELNVSVNPVMRNTHHKHLFGSDTIIIGLDSHVHESPKDQNEYLKSTLSSHSHLRNKFAVYHVALYPSKKFDTVDIVQEVRTNWGPLFDQYNLTIGFENHFHTYKVSYPIKNGTRVSLGQGTLYLGDGCWGVPPGVTQSSELLERVGSYQHIHVVEAGASLLHVRIMGYVNQTITHLHSIAI